MRHVHPEVDGPAPDCFPPAQWKLWCRSERMLMAGGRSSAAPDGFCQVCTAQYKERMVAAGKCRHPDVVFVPDEDGDPIGTRSPADREAWYNFNPDNKEAA